MSEVIDIGAAPSAKKRKRKPKGGERTELNIAEMFTERFAGAVRYCADRGGWHRWTSTHYALDTMEHARECVKVIARQLAEEAAALLDDDVF